MSSSPTAYYAVSRRACCSVSAHRPHSRRSGVRNGPCKLKWKRGARKETVVTRMFLVFYIRHLSLQRTFLNSSDPICKRAAALCTCRTGARGASTSPCSTWSPSKTHGAQGTPVSRRTHLVSFLFALFTLQGRGRSLTTRGQSLIVSPSATSVAAGKRPVFK